MKPRRARHALAGLLWAGSRVSDVCAATAAAMGPRQGATSLAPTMSGGSTTCDTASAAARGGDLGSATAAGGSGGRPAAAIPALDGVEIDLAEVAWSELPAVLPRLPPAVVEVRHPVAGYLVLLRGAALGRRVEVLAPDGRRRRIAVRRLAEALTDGAAGPAVTDLAALTERLSLAGRRRRRVRRGLVAARLASAPGLAIYLLGRPERPERRPARHGTRPSWSRSRDPAATGTVRIPRPPRSPRTGPLVLRLAAALCTAELAALAGWWLLARGALAGRFAAAEQLAWAWCVAAVPLLRLAELRAAAALAGRLATSWRRRLAAALAALPPAACPGEGSGRLLGRLLAAEDAELALCAALPDLALATVELAAATLALAQGGRPRGPLAALTLGLALAVVLAASLGRQHRRCAALRAELSARLVEDLAGHRTRRAQAPDGHGPAARAAATRELAAYADRCRRLGRVEALLRIALPRAFLLAGLLLLLPSAAPVPAAGEGRLVPAAERASAAWGSRLLDLPAGSPGAALAAAGAAAPSSTRLAAALGGTLLGQAALSRLAAALCTLAAALAGLGEAAALLQTPTAEGAESAGSSRPAPWPGGPRRAAPGSVLEALNLSHHLAGRVEPLFQGLALRIQAGDRLVLAGPSGAGKSTLAGLLSRSFAPQRGLLLLHGLDPPTWGAAAWRRRVVAVPQLHANHIFAASLAFNLLLGRAWPPSADDLAVAAAVCHGIGLGPLLDRLPAGLGERVGEAGWSLSDGEASRVCLARGLLQEPDLLILDESLAALDPEARLRVLGWLKGWWRAVLVIAHLGR